MTANVLWIAFALPACSTHDRMQDEKITKLQQAVAMLQTDNTQLRRQLDELGSENPSLRTVEDPTMVSYRPKLSAPPPMATNIAVREPVDPQAAVIERAFRGGINAVRTGNSEAGIPELLKFAEQYPGDRRAAEALFSAATARLVRGEVEGAAALFQRVVARYPSSDWGPNAMLRLGECQMRLKKSADANANWKQLIERYPASEAAGAARGLLKGKSP